MFRATMWAGDRAEDIPEIMRLLRIDRRSLDIRSLASLSRFRGIHPLMLEGRLFAVPVLEPLSKGAPYADFDRAVCAAGIKEFARPLIPGEWSTPDVAEAMAACELVLVREAMPGMRARLGLTGENLRFGRDSLACLATPCAGCGGRPDHVGLWSPDDACLERDFGLPPGSDLRLSYPLCRRCSERARAEPAHTERIEDQVLARYRAARAR